MVTSHPDDDLIAICREIVETGRTEAEWAEVESDDLIQFGRYEGGFDATEMEFCFHFSEDGKEFWLQISLSEVKIIASGDAVPLSFRVPDTH